MRLRSAWWWGLGVAIATAAVWGAAPAGDVLRAAWELVARVQIDAARQQFAAAAVGQDAAAREAKLGQALTILNTQPRTEGNVARAADLLREVQAESRDDEPGIAAAYYLARIAQMHQFTPNPAQALELFTALHQTHPEHPLGQMALVKATMLRLFDPTGDVALPARLQAAEEVDAQLRDPDARRDYHLLLADAYAYFDGAPEASLRHLRAAEAAAVIRGPARADLLVRVTELARETGQVELMRQYGQKFVREYPRDSRAFTIRRQLEEVQP